MDDEAFLIAKINYLQLEKKKMLEALKKIADGDPEIDDLYSAQQEARTVLREIDE